jgi:hypothetical protein
MGSRIKANAVVVVVVVAEALPISSREPAEELVSSPVVVEFVAVASPLPPQLLSLWPLARLLFAS